MAALAERCFAKLGLLTPLPAGRGAARRPPCSAPRPAPRRGARSAPFPTAAERIRLGRTGGRTPGSVPPRRRPGDPRGRGMPRVSRASGSVDACRARRGRGAGRRAAAERSVSDASQPCAPAGEPERRRRRPSRRLPVRRGRIRGRRSRRRGRPEKAARRGGSETCATQRQGRSPNATARSIADVDVGVNS